MQTIIRYFLVSEVTSIIGEKKKQRHAFFTAKGGLAPRRGDILNLNVPRSRIATMKHTDYDQYQGAFEVAFVETAPVFDTTDVKAEFPIVVETIVNVYLTRPGAMDVPGDGWGRGFALPNAPGEHDPDERVTVESGPGSNYAKQAESAMLFQWDPTRMATGRYPLTQEQAEKYVEQFYQQYPLMREWIAKVQAGTHHTSDAFPDTTFSTPAGLRSTIAKLTRSLREAKGITLAVAGRATGYATSRLSAMELGNDYMSLAYLDYLSDHPGAAKADTVSEDPKADPDAKESEG